MDDLGQVKGDVDDDYSLVRGCVNWCILVPIATWRHLLTTVHTHRLS